MTVVEEGLVALKTESLWKCFPRSGGGQAVVLENVSVSINAGEVVCLVGPSGCGKSTLMSILAGLEEPTAGELVDGSGRSAVVFQRDLLLDWYNVLDNVLVGKLLRGVNKQPHVDRARELLHHVGLRDVERLHPAQLSGGMRQRVAICRALMEDPEILFMDEPFGALDAITREGLHNSVLQLKAEERGKTIVFVTHDVAEAVFLGDRVVVMAGRPGRIFEEYAIDFDQRGDAVRQTPEFQEYCHRLRDSLRRAQEASGKGGQR